MGRIKRESVRVEITCKDCFLIWRSRRSEDEMEVKSKAVGPIFIVAWVGNHCNAG